MKHRVIVGKKNKFFSTLHNTHNMMIQVKRKQLGKYVYIHTYLQRYVYKKVKYVFFLLWYSYRQN